MGPPDLAIGLSRLCPPRLTLLPAFGLQSREPAQTAYYLIRLACAVCFYPSYIVRQLKTGLVPYVSPIFDVFGDVFVLGYGDSQTVLDNTAVLR